MAPEPQLFESVRTNRRTGSNAGDVPRGAGGTASGTLWHAILNLLLPIFSPVMLQIWHRLHPRNSTLLFCITTLFLALPVVLHAHTKWFADEPLEPYITSESVGLYISIWAGIIIAVIIAAALLQRFRWLELPALRPPQAHSFSRAASGFAMMVGTYFMIAGSHEYFLTPNLTVDAGIPYIFIIIEIAVGLALVIGLGTRIAALVLAATWIVSFWYTGFIVGIENVWLLSTTLFIALMGNDYFSLYSNSRLRALLSRYKRYALSLLRVGTGLTLMVLGLSEKILAPEYGINFLALYDWNFVAMLGIPYSDLLFTISAGAVEFLFGALIALGLLTRLTVFVVAIVFTIPMFILGPIELTGHLPHFAALIIILLYGNGGHFLPVTPHAYRRNAPGRHAAQAKNA